MIIALGVDYSIFLMMRFNEVDGNPVNAILTAAKNIGGVVISAAIILGGTFAALIPSGVITLISGASCDNWANYAELAYATNLSPIIFSNWGEIKEKKRRELKLRGTISSPVFLRICKQK